MTYTSILSATIPPGEPIPNSNVNIQQIDSQIQFAFNSTSKKPLSPLVQASFNTEGNLQVSAIVFIPTNEKPNFSGVNQQYVISGSGEPQLDFFIIYDAPEKSAQKFQGYRIDFIVENPPKGLAQIETFLWDEDPVSSRGTVNIPTKSK